MESRRPEDSKNVKTSQAYFFEGFISFFEDFSLTSNVLEKIIVNVFCINLKLLFLSLFKIGCWKERREPLMKEKKS